MTAATDLDDPATDPFAVAREAARVIAERTGVTHSHGCSYGQNWSLVQFQRMPNVNLVAAPDGGSLEDLIAGVDDGLLIDTRGSYSIERRT